jgi:hypothetical protein
MSLAIETILWGAAQVVIVIAVGLWVTAILMRAVGGK